MIHYVKELQDFFIIFFIKQLIYFAILFFKSIYMNILYPPIKREQKINQFRIEVSQLILFKSVSLNVILYDQDDNFVCVKMVRLEDHNYKAWADDDGFIIQYVKNVLTEEGLTDIRTLPPPLTR